MIASLAHRTSDNFGVVVYIIRGNNCFFSQVSDGTHNSATNAAEDIVVAIATAEGVDFTELRVFEILTHLV